MKKKFTGSGVEMEKRRLFTIVLLCVLVLVLIGCEERIPIVPEPLSFSQEGGSYYRSIVVEITSEQASSIHYTTDGSIPTKESPVYHEPLIINTTTRLSAIALDEEGIVRQEKKEDYLIPLDTLHCPYLDVAAKTIYHVSPVYEYSRDDGEKWETRCGYDTKWFLPICTIWEKFEVPQDMICLQVKHFSRGTTLQMGVLMRRREFPTTPIYPTVRLPSQSLL
jgi:hypothetical protein